MYQGNSPSIGRFAKLDDISGSFNSSNTVFALTSGGQAIVPQTAQNLLVVLGGVLQEPGVAYTITGSNITFATPVPTSTTFFGVVLGSVLNIGVPSDATVDSSKLTSLDYINLNQATAAAIAAGRARWNDTTGTLELGLKGGTVILETGQEQVYRITNNSGSSLAAGRAVRVTGSSGSQLTVAASANTSEANSALTIGLMSETVANGADGFITSSGIARGLNTSSWTVGTTLWLDSSGGNLTSTKPVPPAHAVMIGFVVKQHASTGEVYVHINTGSELADIHDVLMTGKTAGDVLQYDSVSGLWKNVQKGLGADAIMNGWLTKDMGSVVLDKGTVSTGTVTFDYTEGSCQRLQVGGSLTVALSNFPPSGNLGVMQIELVNGGSATVTMPTINWILKDGTFTTTVATYLTNSGRNALQTSGIDFIMLWSRNGGSTVYGKIL